MAFDQYSAVWVSHSSLSDYKKCPRLYYLKNIYKDPQTGHKLQITSPSLALGQVVHTVLESLSVVPTHLRFQDSLLDRYELAWNAVSGKKGGFNDPEMEQMYRQRGSDMVRRIMNNPGPLKNLSVKVKQELPHFYLSQEHNLILCGKIDWLEYLKDTDSVHIIDFKTSKTVEEKDSLQLPIYYLLVKNTQKRNVGKASYWYLELENELTPRELPNEQDATDQVLTLAKRVKLARQLQKFQCPTGGCRYCTPFELILQQKAEFVGLGEYGHDVYIVPKHSDSTLESDIV